MQVVNVSLLLRFFINSFSTAQLATDAPYPLSHEEAMELDDASKTHKIPPTASQQTVDSASSDESMTIDNDFIQDLSGIDSHVEDEASNIQDHEVREPDAESERAEVSSGIQGLSEGVEVAFTPSNLTLETAQPLDEYSDSRDGQEPFLDSSSSATDANIGESSSKQEDDMVCTLEGPTTRSELELKETETLGDETSGEQTLTDVHAGSDLARSHR
jgi:hypothetical protein